MAYKTLIFGVNDLFGQLQLFYNQTVQRGTLEIIAYAEIKNNDFIMYNADDKAVGDCFDVDNAIVSSANDF